MKKILLILFALILSLSAVSCKSEDLNKEGPGALKDNKEIIAKINDEVINIDEFNKYYAMQSYDFEKEYGKNVWAIEQNGKSMKEIRQDQMIDYLVRVSLIKKYVTEHGFTLEADAIEEAYDKYMKSIEEDTDIQDYFSDNDLDETFLKTFLKDQLYLRVYQKQIVEGIYNSEETMAKLFDDQFIRYKTSHILVEHEDKSKLEDIRTQLLSEEAPADFSLMARENSIHSTSAVRGGELGYVVIGNMPENYEAVALTQELYTVSEITETEYGYHLIFVEDRQMVSDMIELGMPEDEINSYKEEIINRYAALEFVKVFEELKNSTTIEIFRDILDEQ